MKKSRATQTATFGDKPSFTSLKKIIFSLSDDKKAFDLAFKATEFSAGVGSVAFDGAPKGNPPVQIRSYAVVIPVSGQNLKTTFSVPGVCVADPGTHAALLLSVNDQHSVTQFKPKNDSQDFVATLRYQAKAVSDVRITVVLMVQRDAAHPGASALLKINTISTDALVSRKRKN